MALPRSRLFLLTVAAAAAFVVAGCGGDDDDETTAAQETTSAGQPVTTLEVSESDFEIDSKDRKVDEDGLIQFDVTNDGETAHQLSIESREGTGFSRTSDEMDPGEDTVLTVELDSGEYSWYCPIGNHRQLGMDGEFTVGGGGG